VILDAQFPLLDKRWNRRAQRFVAPHERMDPSCYTVRVISVADARAFVEDHHYSGNMPAARLSVGLIREGRIVGVAVFSHPMNDAVLTKYLGTREGCELGRFVLLDSEGFNAETWFLARCFRALRVEKPDLRGVVSFSDPMERRDPQSDALLKRAHFGTIYRAANASFQGRSSARHLLIAPDGSVVNARALSKIRNGERGRDYAERNMIAAGVPERSAEETPRAWLERVAPLLTRVYHPGNLAFTFAL
jgi:hypothetical protein